MFSQTPWLELEELQDPVLQELARKLPNTVLQSRADSGSTAKKYLRAFRRWKLWAPQHQLPVLPAKPASLYLQHGSAIQISGRGGVQCLGQAALYSRLGIPYNFSIGEGHPARLAESQSRRKPLPQLGCSSKWWLMLNKPAFNHCMSHCIHRFRELIEIRTDDISLKDNAMVIKIPHSKTNQFRRGDEVIIARSGKETCPVTYLENYLKRSRTSLQDHRSLFHPICKSKMGKRLREPGSISYTCLWE